MTIPPRIYKRRSLLVKIGLLKAYRRFGKAVGICPRTFDPVGHRTPRLELPLLGKSLRTLARFSPGSLDVGPSTVLRPPARTSAGSSGDPQYCVDHPLGAARIQLDKSTEISAVNRCIRALPDSPAPNHLPAPKRARLILPASWPFTSGTIVRRPHRAHMAENPISTTFEEHVRPSTGGIGANASR